MAKRLMVRVYRNLHRACYSVQEKLPGVGWRVTAHVDEITLEDVEFKVYEKGRQKVLKTRSKNVHCFAIGYPTDKSDVFDCKIRLRYNPYVCGYVFTENGIPVLGAKRVSFTKEGFLALDCG